MTAEPTPEEIAAVPDEAADIARKLLDQIVSGHLESAEDYEGEIEDYSPHPISIEGDARAIVAAVTNIIAAKTLMEAKERLNDQADRVRAKFGDNYPRGHNRVYGLHEAASMLRADAGRRLDGGESK